MTIDITRDELLYKLVERAPTKNTVPAFRDMINLLLRSHNVMRQSLTVSCDSLRAKYRIKTDGGLKCADKLQESRRMETRRGDGKEVLMCLVLFGLLGVPRIRSSG